MEGKRLKICFAASAGGHLEEISQLKELQKQYDAFLLTEEDGMRDSYFCGQVYHVRQTTRKERGFFFCLIKIFFQDFWIFLREKPDCVISTGALTAFPACAVGKLLGKKIIYVESFARINTASLTGRLVYRFADLFLVQWEENLKFYPKSRYIGGIF